MTDSETLQVIQRPLVFSCGAAHLIGVVHTVMDDQYDAGPQDLGIIIVVGGPQYRIGSHRQFLMLAQHFASTGIPTLRFDHRGVGDSDGPYRGFEDMGADIRSAIDAFLHEQSSLKRVVLWGLCDAASAISFYAASDPRVAGIVMVNPWVRTEDSAASTMMKHYYWKRIFDKSLWRKLASGQIDFSASLTSFVAHAGAALSSRFKNPRPRPREDDNNRSRGLDAALPERMAQGVADFSGPIGLIVSGQDLTAREFDDATARSALWQDVIQSSRLKTHRIPRADHTFSKTQWRQDVADWTVTWVKECCGPQY